MSRRKLQRDLRAVQGQSEAIEVCGKEYSYCKLTRRRAQVTLKSLVGPFVRAASSAIGAISGGATLSELLSGTVDIDLDKVDIVKAAEALEAMSDDEYWRLACRILDNVEIDGNQLGRLDDHGYYDDKHWEFVLAILIGVQVNYPFVGAMTAPKDDGQDDSNQGQGPQESGQ
jgi:hypothetical protein